MSDFDKKSDSSIASIVTKDGVNEDALDIWLLDGLLSFDVQAGLQAMASMDFLRQSYERLFREDTTGLKKEDFFTTNVANVYPFACLKKSAEYSIVCAYEHIQRFVEFYKGRTGKDLPFEIYRIDDLKLHRTFHSHPQKQKGKWEKEVMNKFVAEDRHYKDFKPELLWGARASIIEEGAKRGFAPTMPLELGVTEGMFEMVKLIFKLSAKKGPPLFSDETLLEIFSKFVEQYKGLTIQRYEAGRKEVARA